MVLVQEPCAILIQVHHLKEEIVDLQDQVFTATIMGAMGFQLVVTGAMKVQIDVKGHARGLSAIIDHKQSILF